MYSNIEQIKDLLENPNFVHWVNQPNAELDEHWQEWSEKHPERRSDLLLAKRFVKSLHYKNEFMLDEVEQDKMFEQIKAFKQNKDEADRKLIRKINFRKTLFGLSAAASVIMAFIGSVYWTSNENPAPFSIVRSSNSIEVATTYKGQRTKVILPDGSIVHLNAGSSINYPVAFSKTNRVVTLVGEGFFEVVKNKKKPFIVETGKVKTQVLGTSFNVRAYANEKIVQVAVATGKVKMEDKASGKAQFLTPNEMGTLDNTANILKTKVNLEKATGWKKGVLVFDGDNFTDVFTKLEIWYGVNIIVLPNVELKGHYSGEFQQETLENIMQGIAFTSGFQYEIAGKTILIHN